MKKPIQIVAVHSSFPTFDYIINKEGRLLGQDEGIERGQPIQLYGICDDEIKVGNTIWYQWSTPKIWTVTQITKIGTICAEADGHHIEIRDDNAKKVLLTNEQIGFFKEIKSNGIASMDFIFPITIEQLQIIFDKGSCNVELNEDGSVKLINDKAIISMEE